MDGLRKRGTAAVATCALALVAMLSGPATVQAQWLGRTGTLTIGAERISGFRLGERSIELPGGADYEVDYTVFELLWSSASAGQGYLNTPRAAIDYFVIDYLSVGGSLAVFAVDYEDDDSTGFILAPRAGYMLPMGSFAAFWPRGGFTFYVVGGDDPGDEHQLLLSLEGVFTLAPTPHLAVVLGPSVDLGLFGEVDDNDLWEWCIGVQVGLMGWINL